MSSWLGFLTLAVVAVIFSGQVLANSTDPVDISPIDTVFTANRLPTDERYMSSIGNGHVATDVFTDVVYMNGLYNGLRGESHRARVPAWCNVRLNATLVDAPINTTFSLDSSAGVFFNRLSSPEADIEQRIFAHRFYTRAIVNQIVVTAKNGSAKIPIALLPGADSEDITFDTPVSMAIGERTIWHSCGRAKTVEDPRYQREPTQVCAYWTEVPRFLEVPSGTKAAFTYVMTLDNSKVVALKEMLDVLQENYENLLTKHTAEWAALRESGRIEIGGHLDLAKVVNGIWYYLLSSLPSLNSNQPQGSFRGLSPGGLSRGAFIRDYQGHSFWDTETWMYPAILLMQPKLGESLLQYRIDNMPAAADIAIANNNKGLRFPWESAFTGSEVTPDCCPEVVDFEQHITGCIAFAVRQYVSVTGDQTWLKKDGCTMLRKIAEFWASRAEFNNATGFYDIKGVMGPDEDHPNVTNSVFTNVIAGLSLYMGEYASCLCEIDDLPSNPSWSEVASRLTLLYDEELDYHPQYQDYERPTMIKQADAVLLGFPLMYNMNESTKINDLRYYENVTRANGPAMTWSMHTVGFLRLGDNEQAARLFNKSYQPYVRDPFKIWTEAQEPEIGAVNFITGMGGFLQALLFGYGGMSIRLDSLEILKPQLPPDTQQMKIKGIKYLGGEFTMNIKTTNTTLSVDEADSSRPLLLVQGATQLPLSKGTIVVLDPERLYSIRKAQPNRCPLPLDVIGQKQNKMSNVHKKN